MVFVYILGKVETGKEMAVLNAFRDASEVIRGSLTYGLYDFCIEVEFKSMEELDNFIFNVVRKVQGVRDTSTIVVAKSFSK